MKVVVGSDDTGDVLEVVVDELVEAGHEVDRRGVAPWPDAARAVAEKVAAGEADMGVVMCWTGTGTSMMANKVPGVRAALCWEPWIAEGARRWNDANVLVMSLKRITPEAAREIVRSWLSVAEPDPDEAENIEKLNNYEPRADDSDRPDPDRW